MPLTTRTDLQRSGDVGARLQGEKRHKGKLGIVDRLIASTMCVYRVVDQRLVSSLRVNPFLLGSHNLKTKREVNVQKAEGFFFQS